MPRTGLDQIVLSLGGTWDPGLPAAASRAGALGLLDLAFLRDPAIAQDAVKKLLALGRGRLGLVLDSSLGDAAVAALDLLKGDETIVLLHLAGTDLARAFNLCRGKADRIGLVVMSADDAEGAEALGFDFLLAKGFESGGLVSESTSFVLLQELLRATSLPVYMWGGIGWYTAAACRVAGAAGVVLDWQLALMRESSLSLGMKKRVSRMDGSETDAIRGPDGRWYRVFSQPGFTARDRLLDLADTYHEGANREPETWWHLVETSLAESSIEAKAWPIGQDASFASSWSAKAPSVARALQFLEQQVNTIIEQCGASRTLAEGSPVAVSHGTVFPVMQGPMTRVSDVAEFCDAVERGGALPMIALAMMRQKAVREILEAARSLMGDRPWGVGILGFVERELREEQLAIIEEIRPPYAVIAGGRPDQAASMEAKGITSYLHVPSPGMLAAFVREGARRFIFEGLECGGHVGPRTSFVLWETMVRGLLEADLSREEAEKVHLFFAGGIHDAVSGAMVSAVAQPLVEKGMKIGVVMGTAYLFTHEAVSTGAIVERFQEVALSANRTILAQTGPGHAIRCAPTGFFEAFEAERIRLRQEGLPQEEISKELERRNMGRLRIASKAVARAASPDSEKVVYEHVDEDRQRREGMYMIGQVASMHHEVVSIRELHERVCNGAADRLTGLSSEPTVLGVLEETVPPPVDVAIVGMACLLPGAENPETFWDNIIRKREFLVDIPEDRFDVSRWFDPDKDARDKIYSHWGGFVKDIPFDPLKYGIPPASIKSIEPAQLLALELVDRALKDAGLDGLKEDSPYKPRTSVILGAGGGLGELGSNYTMRSIMSNFIGDIDESLWSQLPEWTEDSFAGILLNVVAGRASNKFDLGGVNFTVDAACGSSLAAVYLACRELVSGTSDMVITGGVDTVQNAFAYMCFSKAKALSSTGKPRVFDETADGISISEGLAAVVLKRLADAERDGDRIYAVIRGAAGGSDGRSKSMTAPRKEGQVRTLDRAYAQAGFGPETLSLFEAHGTGTALGDKTECQSVTSILEEHGARPQSTAIGSVKSMIGHTKCSAGVSGLIKTALALYHRSLPPTLNVTKPNRESGLLEGPLYVNTEHRPWIRGETPRRAGVSAFGFGGTNFHAVLEEYEGDPGAGQYAPSHHFRSAELLVFSGKDAPKVAARVRGLASELQKAVEAGAEVALADVAFATHQRQQKSGTMVRTAVVASSIEELLKQLDVLAAFLTGESAGKLPPGVYVRNDKPVSADAVAFLFPGQGSQFPDMIGELAVEFNEVSDALAEADRALKGTFEKPLSSYIYPPPPFSDEDRKRANAELTSTDVAQPALGACDVAVMRLLASFGVKPALVAGHSYGELVALYAAGCMNYESLLKLSWGRGDSMLGITRTSNADLGTMCAIAADQQIVRDILNGSDGVWIANANSPKQTVISGTREAIARAKEAFDNKGISTSMLPVACAFHTPIMTPARDQYERRLQQVEFDAPGIPVFSNTTAEPYPTGPKSIRQRLLEQMVNPVRFVDEVEAMYNAGARVFVEVGPHHVLSRLAASTLGDRPHTATSTNGRHANSVRQFLCAIAELTVAGLEVNHDRLYVGRGVQEVDLRKAAADAKKTYAPYIWLLNGAYARPASEPKRVPQPRATMTPPPASIRPAAEGAPPPTAPRPGAGILPAATGGEVDVYLKFQETMRQFLETQQAVMQSYLTGDGTVPVELASPAAPVFAQPTLPSVPAPAPATPAEQPAPPEGSVETLRPAVPAEIKVRIELEPALLDIVSERTGYPQDMLDLEANMEADLGIDSIKRVEIIAAFRRLAVPGMEEPPSWFMERMTSAKTMRAIVDGVQNLLGESPEPESPGTVVAPAETASPAVTALDYEEVLKSIVADRTGYPSDMLDLAANMEADLGIDSIKRVEIIAAFRRQAIPSMEEPPSWFMERMTSARTMGSIIEGVKDLVGDAAPAGVAPEREAATVAASAGPELDFEAALTEIVAERTGYPADMLDLDANMEADLGIDSIKRVEIIAAYRRLAVPGMDEPPSWFMEQMTSARTLRSIVAGVQELTTGNPVRAESLAGPQEAVEKALPEEATAPRCVAVPVQMPCTQSAAERLPDGVLVITNDGRGVAQAFRQRVQAVGGKVVLLDTALLSNRDSVISAIDNIRQEYGPLAGLVHLVPLRDVPGYPGKTEADWHECVDLEVKSALFLLQAVAREAETSTDGAFTFVTVTYGGGDFDPVRENEASHPWRGGLAGLLKSAAKEWENARFRCIDLEEVPNGELYQILLDEWSEAGPVEVGYRGGFRWGLQLVRREFPDRDPPEPEVTLDAASVVLVTGGARGITAETLLELAAHREVTFILLGRSAIPPDAEENATEGITDTAELRRVLLSRMREDNAVVTPKEVEAALGTLLGAREIRRTLDRLRRAGSRVEYIQCDARDGAALEATVQDVQNRYGGIAALIHGAGVIEDKYIVDKTPDSFDRVMGTKLDPVLTLLRVLDPNQLKLFVSFTSVAGLIGNAGQSDYAAANEVLNRLTRRLCNAGSAKFISLNWGPWSGAGMVADEVAKQFATRGIGLVSIAAGRRALWQEIVHPGDEHVRVLVGPGPWLADAERAASRESRIEVDTPLLAGHQVTRIDARKVEARVTLDPNRVAYLGDHRIDGKAVLPLAVAMELMMEVAKVAAPPKWEVVGVEDLRLFSGVVVDDAPKSILVLAEQASVGTDSGAWSVKISDPALPQRALYQSTVRMAAHTPDAQPLPQHEQLDSEFPRPVKEAYDEWLFHGPAFQAVTQFTGFDRRGMDLDITASSPRYVVGDHVAGDWVFDPIALDVIPQMAILWSRAMFDTTPLPNRMEAFHRYGSLGPGRVQVIYRVDPSTNESAYRAHAWFIRDGRLVGHVEGLEGAGSADLNRIARKSAGGGNVLADHG